MLRPGQSVQVLVRPSALRFADRSAGHHPSGPWHAATIPGPTSTLPVVVYDAAFRGWGYEHVVEVPGGHRLAGVAASTRLPYGAPAHVELAAEGCLVAPSSTGRADVAQHGVSPTAADSLTPPVATVPAKGSRVLA